MYCGMTYVVVAPMSARRSDLLLAFVSSMRLPRYVEGVSLA
jgi:hypothetical protein